MTSDASSSGPGGGNDPAGQWPQQPGQPQQGWGQPPTGAPQGQWPQQPAQPQQGQGRSSRPSRSRASHSSRPSPSRANGRSGRPAPAGPMASSRPSPSRLGTGPVGRPAAAADRLPVGPAADRLTVEPARAADRRAVGPDRWPVGPGRTGRVGPARQPMGADAAQRLGRPRPVGHRTAIRSMCGSPRRAASDATGASRSSAMSVRALCLIPHVFVLLLFGILMAFGALFTWVPVLLLGRQAHWAYALVGGFLRWSIRVQTWGQLLSGTYPPFTGAEADGQHVRVRIDEDQRINRFWGIPILGLHGALSSSSPTSSSCGSWASWSGSCCCSHGSRCSSTDARRTSSTASSAASSDGRRGSRPTSCC